MQTLPLGPGAPDVSVIGFGGMPLSIQGRPDEATGVRVMHAVLDAGVTLLDTANVYCTDDGDLGHNERLFAKAISQWSGGRDELVVATKGGMARPGGSWTQDGHPERLETACNASLLALGVDCIDLYQLHAPDPAVPFADSVGALADLQQAGKIRWIGLSNVSVDQIEEAQQTVTVTTVQNRLNPFFRQHPHDGVVEHCAEHRIGYLAYSPVGGGRLNKKLPAHDVVAPLAKRLGVSPHAVVIAWVRAQGPTVIPIPAGRSIKHALDSLTAADIELSAEDMAAIDAAEFSIAKD